MFEKTAETLSKRGFKVYCVKDAKDALKKCLDIIKIDDVPAFAGSETIKQIGLVEALLERGNEICHRSYLKEGETAQDIKKISFRRFYSMQRKRRYRGRRNAQRGRHGQQNSRHVLWSAKHSFCCRQKQNRQKYGRGF